MSKMLLVIANLHIVFFSVEECLQKTFLKIFRSSLLISQY